MLKDKRNVKKEYGYVVRWIHHVIEEGQEAKQDTVWIEKEDNEKSRIYIVDFDGKVLDEEALKFIKSKTYNGFRKSIDLYDNYVELFEIMGVKKLVTFADLMKEKGYNANRLSIASGVSPMTIGELKRGVSEWKNTTTMTALKLSNALGMTIEEIFDRLY